MFKCRIGRDCDPQRKMLKEQRLAKGLSVEDKEIDHLLNRSNTNEPVDCENDGKARFACFRCGFDVCKPCADTFGGKSMGTRV